MQVKQTLKSTHNILWLYTANLSVVLKHMVLINPKKDGKQGCLFLPSMGNLDYLGNQ